MKNGMIKTTIREIKGSFGRYMAIVAIVMLGVGLFTGLKATTPAMIVTEGSYLKEQNFFDFRLLSTVGFAQEQVQELLSLPEIAEAEGAVSADALCSLGEGNEAVYRFHTVPETINKVVLLAGRMPEGENECLLDSAHFGEDALGLQIEVTDNNDEDTLDMFKSRSFTAVGIVRSPYYINFERGTTSVGEGQIASFCYVPGEAFDCDYLTEIYLTVRQKYDVYTDEYEAYTDSLQEEIEEKTETLARERYEKLISDAEKEIDDAQAELDEKTQEAEEELSDAWQKILDGEQELLDGEQEIADGEQELLDGKQEIADGEQELLDGEQELLDGEKEIADKEQEIADAEEEVSYHEWEIFDSELQLAAARQELEEAKITLQEKAEKLYETETELLSGEEELNSKKAELKNQLEELNGQLTALKEQEQALRDSGIGDDDPELMQILGAIQALEEGISQIQGGLGEIESYLGQASSGKKEIQDGKEQIEEARRELAYNEQVLLEAEIELAGAKEQVTEARAELEDGKAELARAKEDLETGKKELEDGRAELVKAKSRLADAEIELEDGRADLEDGKKELADARVEYADAKAEFDEEVSDAQQKIEDARKELEEIEEPGNYVLTRNSNIGYACYESDSNIVAAIANVFPVFFFLVAALICMTTMTRMVEEQRTQIGVLKALGYKSSVIMWKYLFYAGSAAAAGAVIGCIGGTWLFPKVIWMGYSIMYSMGEIEYFFDVSMAVLSMAAALLCSMGAAYFSCYYELKSVPAGLIRPKAPKNGKRIFLENITFIWSRMKFLHKVSMRNIIRYKKRFFMMILGISGCTALLATGFGIKDSITNVADMQYDEIQVYDIGITFTEEVRNEELEAWSAQNDNLFARTACLHEESVELDFGGKTKSLYLEVPEDAQKAGQFLHLHTKDGEEISYPSFGEAVITDTIAENMGIKVGDEITLRDNDMNSFRVTVSALCENFVSNYIYIHRETYADRLLKEPEYKSAYAVVKEETDVHEAAAAVSGKDNVLAVSVTLDTRERIGNMMKSMDYIVLLIIVCAGSLAFIVLYNLTNINITERIREIATIKVLGFYARETADYVFRENLVLTAIGAAAGLWLGKWLHWFVMYNIKVDTITFKTVILWDSYLWSFLLTFVFAFLVNGIMYIKLEKINMAESLKSIE